ncbi:MAG TPA: hypothetical protein VIT67_11125 [Povalibacter sp.]
MNIPVIRSAGMIAVVMCGITVNAHGDASPGARKPLRYYEQPAGFAGHQWGDPLLSFKNLPLTTPLDVEMSRETGQPDPGADSYVRCVGATFSRGDDGSLGGGFGSCNVEATLASMQRPTHAPDFHLIMQFRNDDQGFRLTPDFIVHPVTHYFCMHWDDETKRPPSNVADRLSYCGVRLDFTSETTEQLASQPAAHVSNYEHLLRYVLRHYGPPLNYQGRVIVLDAEQAQQAQPGLRKFPAKYRWCTDKDPIMAPKCDVKMVLSFDSNTGRGSWLIGASPLQSFALTQAGPALGKRGPLYYELLTSDATGPAEAAMSSDLR